MKVFNIQKNEIQSDKSFEKNNEDVLGDNLFQVRKMFKDGPPYFLNDNHIDDEYQDGDPYTMDKNIDSEFHQRRIKITVSLLEKVLGSKKSLVLDLGCGTGIITNHIKRTFPNIDICGIDYSANAIRTAFKKFEDIPFIIADAYNLPFKKEMFDVVIINNLYEHVPDPLRLMSSIRNVLRQNGHVVISTPSRYRYRNILRILRGRRPGLMSKLHVTEYTVGQIKEQLKFIGFNVTEVKSESISEKNIIHKILKYFISVYHKMVRSENILESTVFYLAIKK